MIAEGTKAVVRYTRDRRVRHKQEENSLVINEAVVGEAALSSTVVRGSRREKRRSEG
jgi:hypothetical protein